MTLLERLIRATPSDQSSSLKSRLLALVFGLLFGGGGIAVLWSASLKPILESRASQNWTEVQGVVISSQLVKDDGSSSVEITYQYRIAGDI